MSRSRNVHGNVHQSAFGNNHAHSATSTGRLARPEQFAGDLGQRLVLIFDHPTRTRTGTLSVPRSGCLLARASAAVVPARTPGSPWAVWCSAPASGGFETETDPRPRIGRFERQGGLRDCCANHRSGYAAQADQIRSQRRSPSNLSTTASSAIARPCSSIAGASWGSQLASVADGSRSRARAVEAPATAAR